MATTRILLVDDDRLILATLSQGLRTAGYDVAEAAGGKEALGILKQGGVDLAVLDVRMPEMSGLEVARWLRENTAVPFMFLSAYGEDEVVSQAVAEGALCYLVKPVDPIQLVPTIEAAVSRGREIRQLRETEQQLSTALASSRKTSVAIGLLMERCRVDEREAFERLRAYARSHRRKVADVADELVRAVELMNLSDGKDSDSDSAVAANNR